MPQLVFLIFLENIKTTAILNYVIFNKGERVQMKMYRIFIVLALALSMTTTAMAQDEFGGGFGAETQEEEDTSPVYTQPTVQTNVSTSADMSDESLSYPGFALGSRLELVVPNQVSAALIEANLAIVSKLSVFVLVGFYVQTYRSLDSEDPPVVDMTDRQGAVFFGGGARLNFRDPAPGHAHLYLSVDLGAGLGVATQVVGGDSQGDAEDDVKEAWDFFTFGVGLGIEYFFVPEFSFAPEVGVRYIINRNEDLSVFDGGNIDKDYNSWLATSFALRFTYHF
jgi:hypothetical protein